MQTGYALYCAGKNALLTLSLALPATFAAIIVPDISTEVAFWGALGGLTRWMATRCVWSQGALGIPIGAFLALGLDGVKLPFLGEITTNNSVGLHGGPFLIGAFGIVIFGLLQDYLTFKRSPK